MVPYSSISETTTNPQYNTNIPAPITGFIRQPVSIIVTTSVTSIMNSSPIEHFKPSEETEFATPPLKMEYSSHGNGNPTVTSKIFDPIDDDTAMSPRPFFATITEVIKSGTEVPAAKNVSPISEESIFQVSPILVAHHTISHENTAIHIIAIRNENMKMLPPQYLK